MAINKRTAQRNNWSYLIAKLCNNCVQMKGDRFMSTFMKEFISILETDPAKAREFICLHGGEVKPHEWSAIAVSLLADATADTLENMAHTLSIMYGNN